ncbi:BREX-1 system adenine-specific DNA-methyltransferase PglX [Candidatus Micrarchaeota archaeon]|jgi:hypothetical protein|nr:BREX-1 system adenine-specific DNA-methyltransferase PglX [Candidatus Micrarchaeota archaeon]
MNKSKIKAFAIWARQKLMDDVRGNASLIGITEAQIDDPLSQSTSEIQYFDIGTNEPYALSGDDILKRDKIVVDLKAAAKNEDYKTAYTNMIEHTASTWFNRIAAIRFMEVNDYFDDGLRVLSSVNEGSKDSGLMIAPFESDIEFTEQERQSIIDWKLNNNNEELFELLLQKKCIRLGKILPGLFSKDTDPTVLLMNFSITDRDSVIWHFTHDIEESDWKEAVEIIGWLYQYYNTEPKDQVFAKLKKNVKITKDNIPAATQLFTPDWIVKYMVENSLGRLWIEGHPDDDLKSNWRYYLDEAKQEPEVEAKLEKIKEEYAALDLENITFIDPCMGSGHILSYAFDVLMQIYKSQGYTDRDAVRSIIEKNLYGIDIDERAYQLAYFAIMMKCRQYDRGFLTRGIVPNVIAISESNGLNKVGEKTGQITFDDRYKEIINYLIDIFNDAREYGSILDVESRDYDGLSDYLNQINEQGGFDLVTAAEFNPLMEKLPALIKQAKVLSRKYDVVVTNPPYMAISSASSKLNDYVNKNYLGGKTDLFSVFIEKCMLMANNHKWISMITMQSWMFLTSFEKLRNKILSYEVSSMAHMGARGFDEISGEVVQTVAFVIQKSHLRGEYKGQYSRLIDGMSEKEKEQTYLDEKSLYINKGSNFLKIPQLLFAYWVSEDTIKCFNAETLDAVFTTREGMATADNERFLRLWQELEIRNITLNCQSSEDGISKGIKWVPYNKGGGERDWYGNNDYVVNWSSDGNEIRNNRDLRTGRIRSHNYNGKYGFKEGLTWSAISSGNLSVRYCKAGFLFDSKGAKGFAKVNCSIYWIMGLLNSKVAMQFLQFISPTLDFKVGDIISIPFIADKTVEDTIEFLVKQNVDLSKQEWDSFESSWDFKRHPLIPKLEIESEMAFIDKDRQLDSVTIQSQKILDCFAKWERECAKRFAQIKENEEELNRIFIDIYGLHDDLTPDVEDRNVTVRLADLKRDVRSLISYAVGCMFGRYSLGVEGLVFAGGEWNDEKYKTFIPDEDNCIPITDENYFSDDIVGRFVEFVRVVYGDDTLEENLNFIADALNGNGEEPRNVIRKYFLNDFFKDHCKTYSVTGSGKRPIYWLFDSGKQNGFKALVYMHRWNSDTIATVRASYVTKVQEKYENELRAIELQLEHLSDPRQKALQQKRKEKIVKQVAEIKQYDELISHLALEHIDIDLDDGVKVNHEKVQHDKNGDRYGILAPIK